MAVIDGGRSLFLCDLFHYAIDLSSKLLEVNVNPVYFDKLSTRSLKHLLLVFVMCRERINIHSPTRSNERKGTVL